MTSNQPPAPRDNRGGSFPPRPQFPPGYLQKGYFDEKGNILPQVIQEWAKIIAGALFNTVPKMTTGQLRGAFFNEVRRLERRLDATRDFDTIRPELLKLSVFAADRRKKNKVSNFFEEFITINLREAAKGEKEFKKGFVNHFECVVGFYPEVRGN